MVLQTAFWVDWRPHTLTPFAPHFKVLGKDANVSSISGVYLMLFKGVAISLVTALST